LEYLPGNVRTFRDKRMSEKGDNSYKYKHDFLAESKTGPYGLNKADFLHAMSNTSDKKTVRFAETSEGLLKAIPFDPSFNDSEYIHDMRHNI
jgi:hypothetical protein